MPTKRRSCSLGSEKLLARIDYNSPPRIQLVSHFLKRTQQVMSIRRRIFGMLRTLSQHRRALHHDLRVQMSKRLLCHILIMQPLYSMASSNTKNKAFKGWLSTRRRCEFITASLTYSIISFSTPSYLSSLFLRRNIDVTDRTSTRLPQRAFITPVPKTVAFDPSFVVTASSLINTLGYVTFSDHHVNQLKFSLFNELFALDRSDWERRVESEGILLPPVIFKF